MDRRPAIKPGPDLRQADTGRDDDSFDSATDGDGFSRLDTGVTGMTGSSIDTLYDLGLPAQALADESEDAELDEPVPNAERLVAQAVALAGDDHDAATLVDRFWRFAPDEELIGFTAEEMLEAARAHRDLAQQRVPGELKLRIHEPDAEQHHTVVEIVTDDMPFLVDSVTALLNSHHLDVHLLVHPLVVVRREPLGRLTEVSADVEPDDAIAGDLVESWMRIEIDPVRDPAERETLRRELQRVLTDVREAVEDWPKMRQRALALADELAAARTSDNRPPVPEKDITDSVELLRWLAHDHFTFLGYREYRLVDTDGARGGQALEAVLGTGLGILRSDSPEARSLNSMTPEAHEKVLEKRLLIITKANSRATVHRSAYLDYIGFKIFNEAGEVVGERRFLGLFSTAAYRTSVQELPVVRRKVAEVLDRSGLSLRSHSGKDLLQILETYPRDELFQIKTDDLYHAVIGVLRMAGRRQLRVFLRRDAYGRFISCLIYLPRDRFTTQNRLRMQDILLRELNGVGVDYTTRVTESMLARVHFIVRTDPNNPPGDIDADLLAEELADATRLWDDDYRLVLERKLGDEQAKHLFARYADAFPEGYKDGHTPYEAMKDLAKLELLEEPGQLEMHLFRKQAPPRPYAARAADADETMDVRFKVYRYGEPMMLSAVLPVLHSLGVKVVDEHPYEVERVDGRIWLYDFGLELPERHQDLAEVRPHVENAFAAAWRGEAEVDGFNELVLRAGLTWRQVVVLRAYAKYLRQAGTVFSQEYMEQTFIAYPQIAELLVKLFETRFAPGATTLDERRQRSGELVDAIGEALDEVASLDQDRILRAYLTLIQATLRTSFYQKPVGGRPKAYVAFKLDPQAIPDLPAPRPKFEIFVYSPRFEGVHLRYGPVARGGLRWSDRREDFRTEVLGLVKAQMVKNAVIVPVGAKGGFVLKQKPGDRDEAVICYKEFISALLDVTDNIVSGEIVPPDDVVRHDGDDPYMVVAADKGTATFSDIANEISEAHSFWLGDAFASGGSAGYDHKKMGITARGAWESVKRHFRELGHDTQTQDFTVVGVGDMSGDVFGNGMLLSKHIRLVAAFDHRHIFLDPDPDSARSWEERKRLFDMPRSSWEDYDRELISEGGGVHSRTAKSVPISPQVRAVLGLDEDVTQLSPQELMKAILTAPVDLFWNGGIGTYVKASSQTNAEVGDKSNDAIRVDGKGLRCRVVGEGGNLGFTQQGRIEYASTGGRIYTDFIDNAAGVDCSDHEVNIKILLNTAVADGELDRPERDELLAQMTDEVADLVLRDNYDQARALNNAQAQAASLLPVHRRMINELERSGALNRSLEALPSDEELAVRTESGLTAPEFAVLLAYVKIVLEREIVGEGLADEEWTTEVLVNYFPTPLRQRFAERMGRHRLRRDIVTTVLVNEAINRGGISFVFRVVEETAASAADVLRAYVVVREVFGLRDLWDAVEALDNKVSPELQTAVYLDTRRLLDRAVRWLVTNRRSPIDVPAEIARLRDGVARLLPDLENRFWGTEREAIAAHIESLVERGLPRDLAEQATRLMYSFGLLDIVETAQATGRDVSEVASVYFVLSDRFRVDALLSKISLLPREDRWQTLARMALRYDLYAALAALTAEVLGSTPEDVPPVERVQEWEQANATSIHRAHRAMGEFDESRADLSALSVLLRQIRTLVRTSAAA
ncbi:MULTISPECIES: NAD-glutamate dehydrogenase [unclassified Micromonospora]|uniref:NAD-glutamate dehydrogenase n=1 Tax=unclassified Micromonospora TaxID=2617518 RepID=UPI00188EE5E6|nr:MULTISPECIES: NAD-glutamate dehydrogenase [unclassified Micromonospora]MBF5030661.1 NAD-glutamate dehydrogenase [Micromonospora sp. ANENR4]MCZ7477213.1 NAD-glutamate dehydrogenase [Micromonospora sp. WMMC273]WBC01987.1 NAD-glutamate dehydrogenase [Micromonospora sp. WMMA1976]